MTEYITITDTARLAIEQDEDAYSDDPRDWTPDVQLKVYATSSRSSVDSLADMTGAGAIFADHMVGANSTPEVALAFARQWIRKHGSTEQIDTFSLVGYSQSDWWDVVVVVPDDKHGTPDSYAQVYEMWARGDVSTVSLERRASWVRLDEDGNLDHDHEYDTLTTWEEVESIGGCYLSDTYTAQQVALEHWASDLTDTEREALSA